MKRSRYHSVSLLAYLILLIAFSASFGQNYASAGWVDGSAEYPLPVIDGEIDPIWEVQESYELWPDEGLYTLKEDTEIPDEDDYSIQFRIMWNAENQMLYVLFEMTDDTLVTDSSGEWTPDEEASSEWFKDDACTIMLRNFQEQNLEFAWVPFTPYEHKAFRQYPDAEFFQEDVVSAWAETESGYVLETMIYYEVATGLTVLENDEIAFDAQGKDDDNGEHFDYKVYFSSNGPSPDGILTMLSKENSNALEPSAVVNSRSALESFTLEQNYPNPFNPTTDINFTLQKAQVITLTVYNNRGQVVKELLSEYRSEGQHRITFDGSELTSGVYFYTLRAPSFSQTRKMILLQ